MNIKTSKSDLLKSILMAIKAIPSKTPLPILDNFLLKVSDGTLAITASDQQITITSKCAAEGDGEACVPAKVLLELIKALPDVEISMSTDENSMTIDWGVGHSAIPVFPVADYPEVSGEPDIEPISFSCSELKQAIISCAPCTANDEMRPILSGIYFNPVDGKYEVAASDAHCMVISKTNATGDKPFLLHKNAAIVIKDFIGDGDAEVKLGEKTIYVSNGEFSVSVRNIEGKFPNYRSVIPSNNTLSLDIDKTSFISAIKRVSTCSNKNNSIIKLTLSVLGGCVAETQDLSFNTSAKEVISGCSYEGEDMSIGLKSSIILQVLSAFKSDSLRMKFSSSNKAVLVESDEEDTKAIMMPVQVV